MSTKNNQTKELSNQQIVNELIGRLGALIDELQFRYCAEDITKTDDKEGAKVNMDIPWDDTPFV